MAVGVAVVAALLSTTAAIAAGGHDDRTNQVRRALDGGTAKTVIMFLGDGMGDSEITSSSQRDTLSLFDRMVGSGRPVVTASLDAVA